MKNEVIGLSQGIFPDITNDNNNLYISFVKEPTLTVLRVNITTHSIETMYKTNCIGTGFARIKYIPELNELWLGYRTGDGLTCYFSELIVGLKLFSYKGTFYNWPLIIGDKGFAINDLTPNNSNCRIYDFSGNPLGTKPPKAGTGLARMTDTSIISNDENRAVELEKWQLLNPEYAGEVFCGEALEGGVAAVYNNSIKGVFLQGTNTFVPKITKYKDKWAIVTGDYNNINLIYNISAEDFGGIIEPPPVDDKIIHLKSGDKLTIIVD